MNMQNMVIVVMGIYNVIQCYTQLHSKQSTNTNNFVTTEYCIVIYVSLHMESMK